jgi:hypothetical protein
MARTVFLFLLLINLMAFAWIYFYGDDHMNAGREPLRVGAQLAPERIRLVPPATDVGLAAAASLSSSPAVPMPAETCRAFAGAAPADAQQIAKMLADKLPGARVAVISAAPPQFELVIAGLASRATAESKQGELKKLGLTEATQIREESDKRMTILIASYSDKAAADEGLKAAAKKGVRSASIAERKPVTDKSTLEVRGSDAALKKLPDFLAQYKTLGPAAACAKP